MRSFKGFLLTGTAILALVACSSDKGPGEIGTVDDIVVRNHGEKVAVPPPGAEPVKEVKIAEAATEGNTAAPSAAEMIAAEDTGGKKTVEQTAAAAQEAQEKTIAQTQEQAADAAVAHAEQVADAEPVQVAQAAAAAPVQADTAPGMNWNQPRRIETPEDADKLVEEQMAQSAPPAAAAAPATAPAPAAPPSADVAATTAAPAPAQAASPAAAPKIPVTAPENYTQDPDAPYSPAAARAAAAAQTGTPSDAPAAPAAAPTPVMAEPAPQPLALAKGDGQMPLDPALLQSKDPATIKSLQKTLADAGFYKGALNGEMNSDTLNAYVKYQTAAQANVAAQTPAAPAPVPAEPAVTAPTPVPTAPSMTQDATAAPTPVMDQAPMQMMTPATPDMNEAAPPVMRQRAAVSRRTPQELPPVAPIVPKTPVFPEAVPAPSVQHAPAPTPVQAAPATFGANVSVNDPAVISAAQKALAAKGLYTGPVNGMADADTLNAVIRYQSANNLAPGLLNVETLQSLGVVK